METLYRAGALVLGDRYVLPLLEAEVLQSGWVGADEFHTYFPVDSVALHAKQALSR